MRGSVNDLFNWLLSIGVIDDHGNGRIFAVRTDTHPELLVKSRADGTPTDIRFPAGVAHVATRIMRFQHNYGDMVNAQLEREGKEPGFVPRLKWEIRDKKTGKRRSPFVRLNPIAGIYMDGENPTNPKNGTMYLSTRSDFDGVVIDGRIQSIVRTSREAWYDLATGLEITGEELQDLKDNFLEKSPAMLAKASASAKAHQGTDTEIPWRDFKTGGIVEVHAECDTFAVVPSPLAIDGIPA